MIRQDAAYLRRRQEDKARAMLGEERRNGLAVDQVQLTVRPRQDVGVAQPLQLAMQRRAHQAAVPGNIDRVVQLHKGR